MPPTVQIVPGKTVATWHGVTVENGRVAILELWTNNLSGNLPVNTVEFPGLGDLTGLRELELGGNQLTGSIPGELICKVLCLMVINFQDQYQEQLAIW